MSGYDDSYWEDFVGEYDSISWELAERVHAWMQNYISQHAGVDISDDVSAAEEARLNSYFSDAANLNAYWNAIESSDWYAEYMQMFDNWDDWDDGWEDDWDDNLLGSDNLIQSYIDDVDLPVTEAVANELYNWVADYLQTTGVNINDGVDESELYLLENYFGDTNNIQHFVDSMEDTSWFTQWKAVYDKGLADGSVGHNDFIFADYLDGDDVQLWDEDGALWNSQIKRADGLVIDAEEAQLYRAYAGAMGRTPDEAGYNWWLGEIEAGRQDLNSMAGGFVHSDEFKDLADSNDDGAISNAEFVTHMYEGVFGREPDEAGFDYWVGELDSGRYSQAGALVDMTQSNEYVEKTYLTVADMLFI